MKTERKENDETFGPSSSSSLLSNESYRNSVLSFMLPSPISAEKYESSVNTNFDDSTSDDGSLSSQISDKIASPRTIEGVEENNPKSCMPNQNKNVVIKSTWTIDEVGYSDKSENITENETNGKMYLLEKMMECKGSQERSDRRSEEDDDTLEKYFNMSSIVHGIDDNDYLVSAEALTYEDYELCEENSLERYCENSIEGILTDSSVFLDNDHVQRMNSADKRKSRHKLYKDRIFNSKQPQKNLRKTSALTNPQSLSSITTSRGPVNEPLKSSKYTVFHVAMDKRQREKQIRDVYTKDNKFKSAKTPVRAVQNVHKSSSLINRNMKCKEILRVNRIIVNKILNVRSTIPKATNSRMYDGRPRV